MGTTASKIILNIYMKLFFQFAKETLELPKNVTPMTVLFGQNGQTGQNVPCPAVVGHNNVSVTVSFQSRMTLPAMGTRERFEPVTLILVLSGRSGQNGHHAQHLVGEERN